MRSDSSPVKKIDKWLLGLYLIMTTIGIINIYSADYNSEHPEFWSQHQEYGKQLLWFVISLGLGGIILLLEGSFFRKYAFEFYGVICVLCIAVLIVGEEKNGAKAWFGIGSFGIQPSEFAKVGVALALARFLSTPQIRFDDMQTRLYTSLFIAFPAFLILLQPDAGTVIVFTSFIFVLYREGMSGNTFLFGFFELVIAVITLMLKEVTYEIPFVSQEIKGIWGMIFFIVVFSLAAVFLVRQLVMRRNRKAAYVIVFIACFSTIGVAYTTDYAYYNVLKSHQRERIDISLGLVEDPDGKGYNTDRAMAAIGSGGFAGKGYKKSTLANAGQKHVPMSSTDFIYCTWSEEWGFVGSVFVILLFSALFFRLIIIAERQRSSFTRIFTYCVASILFFHFLINIGMATGLAPVIGIPLPFFSYGGSSLMAFSIMVFIILKLDSERLDVLR